MSGSFKKTPSCHFVKKQSEQKKLFNRRLRRAPAVDERQGVSSVPDGNAYRRANESYDIADWHDVGRSYEDYRARHIRQGSYVDERTCRRQYEKQYLRK